MNVVRQEAAEKKPPARRGIVYDWIRYNSKRSSYNILFCTYTIKIKVRQLQQVCSRARFTVDQRVPKV